MLARWPSKQDHKGDNVGELIASLCTKYSMSDLRQHKKMVRYLLIKGHEFPSVGLGSAEGLGFHCQVRVEEIKEVTWGNLLWYTGLNWKLCFLSWIHISSWRAPDNILLASLGGYRSCLLDRCFFIRRGKAYTDVLPETKYVWSQVTSPFRAEIYSGGWLMSQDCPYTFSRGQNWG